VETASFSGFTYPELLDVFPGQKLLERTSMNSWDDQKVRDAQRAEPVPVCGGALEGRRAGRDAVLAALGSTLR
jgi:hypothetical protein